MLSRRPAGGGGVGEVDASVPDAVTELPDMEFGGIGEGGKLSEESEGMAEVVGDGRRKRAVGDGRKKLRLLD